MSLEDFQAAVQAIADKIWAKYGPRGLATSEAYQEIKAEVSFSSWMVSPAHKAKASEYCDQIQEHRYHSLDMTVSEKFISCVEKTLSKICEENVVAYWCVRFIETKRFLMVGELDTPQSCVEGKEFETPANFSNENEAEEAAQEFCNGYLTAGIEPPPIQIVAINIHNKEIPKGKIFVGKAPNKTIRQSYPMTEVPNWCKMSPEEHQDNVGGCWGIASGEVARKGTDHCGPCEYLEKNDVQNTH